MPATLPLLRTSERKDFKKCPWLWQQSWESGLTTINAPTWSWFGTAIHKGLEVYYPPGRKRGKKADVLDAFLESVGDQTGRIWTEGGEVSDVEVEDARELGKAMLLGYIEHYGKDSHWEVIHGEQPFQIDVPHPSGDGSVLAVYAGTWDLVIRDIRTGEYWVVDHKTRKTFPSNWEFYEIDDQAGSYLWVAPEVLRHMGIFGKKDSVRGLIFNALKKAMPDTRILDENGMAHNAPNKKHFYEALEKFYDLNPLRLPSLAVLRDLAAEQGITVLGDISARQPVPLFHREEIERADIERARQGQRVQQEVMWMNAIRRGELEAFKTPTEDCVRCILFEYCKSEEYDPEEGREIRNATLRHRDPYRDHREAFEANGAEVKIKTKKGK
jgi:hypothetical protein